jgi:hypothetical protein
MIENDPAVDSLVDTDGTVFDESIHAVSADGTTPKVKRDGTFARKPGRRTTGATPTAKPAPRGAKPRAGVTDYRPGMFGIVQLAAGVCMAVSPLDGYALSVGAPPLVEALQQTSETSPALAAVLDKIMSVGPWGLVIGAALPLIIQIAHNHKLIPAEVATSLGARDRDDISRELFGAVPA